jgi:signal transduction histidine kinase
LRLKRCDGALVVRLDAKLIKQAVLNLMINGLQAMEGRGGELILVACTTAKELLIEVIDTGGGIAPDAVERVFHAYYSTKKGGTGLGLAMARRIAEEHGGCLTVKSEPGKGSIFTLHLPM